jgi:hypothetical protein
MDKTKKGEKPTIRKMIRGAAAVPTAVRITGSSLLLSPAQRGADIGQVHRRLDRFADDLAALKREVVDLKRRSRRPRRKGQRDPSQLELVFDTCSASAEQLINARKSP